MGDVRFDTVSYGPRACALIPALCFAALVAYLVRSGAASRIDDGRFRMATITWVVPHMLLLAATTVWYALGIGTSNIISLVAFCGVALVSGCLSLRKYNQLPPVALLLAVIVICGVFALEFSYNSKWTTIGPQFWVVEGLLVGGLLCGLWFLSGRRGIGPAIGLAALTIIGIIQHYVLEFRGTAVLPSDILAMGTALSVSGGYTYDLSDGMLRGFSAFVLGMSCCSLLWRPSAERKPAVNMACGTCCLAFVCALALIPNYATVFGAQLDYWWSKDWYERQGFLPSFIFAYQDLAIHEPDGYTEQKATEVQDALANLHRNSPTTKKRRPTVQSQFKSRKPNIIVIQNETFCDLSVLDKLKNDYHGPEFWNRGLTDALARGKLAVSVFGGGTCNTEFEFLTGNSLAFLGTSKYPFTMYDCSMSASLPRQLKEQGYRSVGMHPNVASNWNRNRAYEQLGFDDFLDEDAFAGAETYHTHVSDWATYDKALSLCESSDEPVFVFDVTMQNHSGYDTGSIPAEELRNYRIEGLGEEDVFKLNEFLACIDESDRAFERLVAKLKSFDEPTVVVMYGDHHPWMSADINDLLFSDEEALIHAERIHNTDYVMWANYDLAAAIDPEADGGDTSSDYLAAMTLDAIGAPTSDFQDAQLGARQTVRAVNASGYLDNAGIWHELGDQTYELSLIEYLNFGSKV